jgi:hypothetical protein
MATSWALYWFLSPYLHIKEAIWVLQAQNGIDWILLKNILCEYDRLTDSGPELENIY